MRGDGFFYGIELVKDKGTVSASTTTRASGCCGATFGALFDAGLICRADDRGDPVVQLAPPLICGQTEIDFIVQVLREVLSEAWRRV